MANSADLIEQLSSPKSQPAVGTVDHDVFTRWRASIQHHLPSPLEELVELYLQSWTTYHRRRLQDDPGGEIVAPLLSPRGTRLLMLTDALRHAVHARLTVNEIIVLQDDEDERLQQVRAEVCVRAGIFKTVQDALASFAQDIFPPEALRLI